MEIGTFIIAVTYFAPFVIAYTRNTIDKQTVFWFNVFGFTGIGYIVATYMAVSFPTKENNG